MINLIPLEDYKKSGIYTIINKNNNKIYVGSAKEFKKRFDSHLTDFKRGKHRNKNLQNSYNKHGADRFEFEVLDYVENLDDLLLIEHMYIVLLSATNKHVGYNKILFCNNMLGFKHSEETKQKFRDNAKKQDGELNHMFGRFGEKSPTCKLTDKQILEIKQLFVENNLSNTEIAKLYNVSICLIGLIRNGKSRTEIKLSENEDYSILESNNTINNRRTNVKLNENDVIKIRELLNGGMKISEVSKLYNVNSNAIGDIKSNKTWKWLK